MLLSPRSYRHRTRIVGHQPDTLDAHDLASPAAQRDVGIEHGQRYDRAEHSVYDASVLVIPKHLDLITDMHASSSVDRTWRRPVVRSNEGRLCVDCRHLLRALEASVRGAVGASDLWVIREASGADTVNKRRQITAVIEA